LKINQSSDRRGAEGRGISQGRVRSLREARPIFKGARRRVRPRTQTPVIEKFKIISADCQLFGKALRLVRASNPPGVPEDGVLSMAIAVHLEIGPKENYRY
jgi:hypothetical protein